MTTKTTENSNTTASATASTSGGNVAADKKMKVGNASVDKEEMANSSLHKFFVSALKDIYFAENSIIEALEKMQEAATTEELKDAFEDHQLQTKKHVSRLEKIFKQEIEKYLK
ncbi:DUF892 family protein [Chryseobacterium sp. SIMBA_028]|uniref:DUF892 family protein n=1 Tax=Chryseobacterium sp. SIMBA_028 TaxID=3085771 RepID=UPI003979F3F8